MKLTGISNLMGLLGLSRLFILAAFTAASAQEKPPPVKPLQLIDQCRSLTPGSSSDAEVASLKDKNAAAKIYAAHALSMACDQRAVEPLTAMLADEDPLVRVAAIEALGKLGDPGSVAEFNYILDDKDHRVRLALVHALASYKTFNARNLVVNGIANPIGKDVADPEDVRVRCTAILTMTELTDVSHSRKSILFLYHFMKSEQAPIRALGEQTMHELKNSRNGPSELRAILKQSPNPELRRWSARWIGKLGIEIAKDALQDAAANDREISVRQVATEALKNWGR